jgi:hypothetical protein
MSTQKPVEAVLPLHLSSPVQRAALHERVKRQFGAFGHLAGDADTFLEEERGSFADDFSKQAVQLIAAVAMGSLVAYVISAPRFEGPGTWSSSPRIDTALVIIWGPLLAYAMTRLKLTQSVRTYLTLALFIEPFSEVMFHDANGYWDSVLWPAAVAFYGTLKEWSGLPGASLPVFFFVTAGLFYRASIARRVTVASRPPRFAKNLLLLFLATVVGLSLLGLARGGGVEPTFRQTVHLMQLPLIAGVFLYALRVPEDLPSLGTIYVTVALTRAVLVAYVYFAVCMPQGITEIPGSPEWCTTHSDSILFVSAILVVVTHAFEQRTKRAIVRSALVTLALVFAIVLNNRRLAFVSLLIAPAIIYLALPRSRRKRRVTAVLAIVAPLAIAYVLVGGEADSTLPFFKPAKLVMSVFDQKDASSLSRDIENENLIYTLRQSPVLSTGFGFEYLSSPNNPPVDLSEVFKNYRFIAHNGVLWIWSLGGLVGFTLLWLIFPIAGTLALRGYHRARAPIERSAALTSLGAVAVCVVQIWGDQGLNGYITPVTFGVAFAVATRLAAQPARQAA